MEHRQARAAEWQHGEPGRHSAKQGWIARGPLPPCGVCLQSIPRSGPWKQRMSCGSFLVFLQVWKLRPRQVKEHAQAQPGE